MLQKKVPKSEQNLEGASVVSSVAGNVVADVPQRRSFWIHSAPNRNKRVLVRRLKTQL